jgi:hypothetical protein
MKHMFQLGEHCGINTQLFTDSDYLLPPEYVDQFKDKVGSSPAPGVPVEYDKEGKDGRMEGPSEETLQVQWDCCHHLLCYYLRQRLISSGKNYHDINLAWETVNQLKVMHKADNGLAGA